MKAYYKVFLLPILFIFSLIVIFTVSNYYNYSLYKLGIYPFTLQGFVNIFTFPLIHGSWQHLFSNISALFVLYIILFYMYNSVSYLIFIASYLLPGLLTWFIGRESYHIGASGIVFCLISFIFFIGLFSRNRQSLATSLIVALYYGGFIWGVFPSEKHVSWETHLGGFITGILLAYFFKDFKFTVYKPKVKVEYSNQSSTSTGYEYEYMHKKKKSSKITGLLNLCF